MKTLACILSWAITLLLLVNSASAQELSIKQKILMPGPLISGHEKYETECETCHSPFSKANMTSLCLDCHKPIAKDRVEKQGFHGQLALASTGDCKQCHTDHEGRDANITGLIPEFFDHKATRFPLQGTHSQLDCAQCHEAAKPFRGTPTQCLSCHQSSDVHKPSLGQDCQQCHNSVHWSETPKFDHQQTQFPLEGKHQALNCVSCHQQNNYSVAATQCADCHQVQDVHQGSNGSDCASCHSVTGWDNLNFDHSKTQFPLTGKHDAVSCSACHLPSQAAKDAPLECSGCHGKTDIHLGLYGNQCETCHTTKAWQQPSFRHNNDTDFPLTGKHADLNCGQCHTAELSKPLPRDCGGCHLGDDVHQEPGMALCATCHNTKSWKGIAQFNHDFAQFPLVGLHQLVPCQNCHVANQFSLGDSQCSSCHLADDVHKNALGSACETCHTPNAWNLWQFDHAEKTHFALDGKHDGLACEACHQPGANAKDTSPVCGRCHRRQDIHSGGLGDHCDTCHNTTNFFELWLNQDKKHE